MAANENKLGELHEKIADVLLDALEGEEMPGYSFTDPNTEEVTVVPPKHMAPSAAIIAAGITFLKNNNITCTVSDDNKLGDLAAKMAAKRANREARREDRIAATEASNFFTGLPS